MSDAVRAQAEQRVGTTLSKWRIDALVGVGGMAAVYAATHRAGHRVAIKVLHAELSPNATVRERFMREPYVANRVKHRGAVSILDDDVTPDGCPFFVMDLLEGEALDALARRRGRLDIPEVLWIADGLLDLLAVAHDANIIHRDIKPQNIFITAEPLVRLLDFGVARVTDAMANATVTGAVLGTPAYMAPEHAQGLWSEVDGRADLWAVGATMFRLLTGQKVHEAQTVNMQLVAAATKPAASVADVSPDVPRDLVAVVDHALAFDKQARWPDARAMQAALAPIAQRLGMRAPKLRVDELQPPTQRTMPEDSAVAGLSSSQVGSSHAGAQAGWSQASAVATSQAQSAGPPATTVDRQSAAPSHAAPAPAAMPGPAVSPSAAAQALAPTAPGTHALPAGPVVTPTQQDVSASISAVSGHSAASRTADPPVLSASPGAGQVPGLPPEGSTSAGLVTNTAPSQGRSFALPALVGLVAVAAIGGAIYYTTTRTTPDEDTAVPELAVDGDAQPEANDDVVAEIEAEQAPTPTASASAPPNSADELQAKARQLIEAKRYDDAQDLLARAKSGTGSRDYDLQLKLALALLAQHLAEQGNLAAAEQLLKEAVALGEKHLDDDDPAMDDTLEALQKVLEKQGKDAEAAAVKKRRLPTRPRPRPEPKEPQPPGTYW